MTRRARAISVLGVAAPICLLAFAWVADRMYHHRSCPVRSHAQADAVIVETEVVADVEEVAFPGDLNVPELRLHQDAAGCYGWRAATWLLHELDGAPLPRTAYNRAKRIDCAGYAD